MFVFIYTNHQGMVLKAGFGLECLRQLSLGSLSIVRRIRRQNDSQENLWPGICVPLQI